MADVAEPRGAEQRIAERVQQHVAVRMREHARAYAECARRRASRDRRRRTRARRNPGRSACRCSCGAPRFQQIAAARRRSSGSVILMLSAIASAPAAAAGPGLDRLRLVGRVAPAALRRVAVRDQHAVAEHLRRQRAPQRRCAITVSCDASLGIDARFSVSTTGAASRPPTASSPSSAISRSRSAAQARPRGVVHQHPVRSLRAAPRAPAARAHRVDALRAARTRSRSRMRRDRQCAASGDRPRASATTMRSQHRDGRGTARAPIDDRAADQRQVLLGQRCAEPCGARFPPRARRPSSAVMAASPAVAPRCASAVRRPARLRGGTTWKNVSLLADHAEVGAGALLDRRRALLQVLHFGGERAIALAQALVLVALRVDLPPAAARPRACRRRRPRGGTAAAPATTQQSRRRAHFMRRD